VSEIWGVIILQRKLKKSILYIKR